MADRATYAIAVICEARADCETATTLSDRVFVETIDWVEEDTCQHYRHYRGESDNDPFLKWTDAKHEARRYGVHVHGHKGDARPRPEAKMAERALLLLATRTSPPDAVILMRDADKEHSRREGFEQARAAREWPFKIAIGVADPKRECWILAGFEAQTEEERRCLVEERRSLGFDPCIDARELTAAEEGAKKDAKRVLFALTGGDHERERACLVAIPLDRLRERGVRTGLTDYLDDVEEHIVPLVKGT